MPRPLSEQILEHLIDWKARDWPFDPAAVFDRNAPTVLEIGFGDGAFLVDQALRHPERDHIGIELAWDPIQRLFNRLERDGLTNVKVLRCDAALAVGRVFASGRLTAAFINHPDPWPKERHHSRRLIQPEFLRDLSHALVPGGEVRIATDHAGYAEWITAALEECDELENLLDAPWVPELEGHLVTRYQMKAREQGIGNHFFVRRSRITRPRTMIEEPLQDMPNVSFDGKVDLDEVFTDFEPFQHRERHGGLDVVIHAPRAFREAGSANWLVEVMIREGRFNQQIAFNVLQLEDGRITVKSSAIGFPRATTGVKRAVWHIARYVLSRAPGLTVVNSNVGDLEN